MKVGGVFSGIGGFELGLERAGMDIAWHCENNPWSQHILKRHWPDIPCYNDVTEVHAMPAAKITVVEFDAAVTAYKGGQSLEQISDHLPITRQALWERFRRAGVIMRPQPRYGASNHFYRGGVRGADWAHNKVENALMAGKLERPLACEECGGPGKPFADGRSPLQAHHPNYNRPLDVQWLCQACHHEWHKHHEPVTLAVMPTGSLPPIDVLCGGFP